jgi:hypothetical protein
MHEPNQVYHCIQWKILTLGAFFGVGMEHVQEIGELVFAFIGLINAPGGISEDRWCTSPSDSCPWF